METHDAEHPAAGEAHHDDPSTTGQNPIGKACNFCRVSHTACGPERPCKRCIKIGKAHLCSDVPMRKRGRPRKTDPRYRPRKKASASSSSSSSLLSSARDQEADDDSPNSCRATVDAHASGERTGQQSAVPRFYPARLDDKDDGSAEDEDSDDRDGSDYYDDDDEDSYSPEEELDHLGRRTHRTQSGAPAGALATNVIEMMSAEMKKMRSENQTLREKMKRLKEKHKWTKKRLAEVLDQQAHRGSVKIEPDQPQPSGLQPYQLSSSSTIAVSPSLREARKYLPFLEQYSIPASHPFVIDNMFSHPVSAIVVNGLESGVPPVLLYTNDAFASMLQYSPNELIGQPLVSLWAHNIAIQRRVAPVLIAKAPWSVSDVYRMSALLRRRDGTTFRSVSHVQFFYDQSGFAKYSISKMLKWKNDTLHDGEHFGSWPGVLNILRDYHDHQAKLNTPQSTAHQTIQHQQHMNSHLSSSPPMLQPGQPQLQRLPSPSPSSSTQPNHYAYPTHSSATLSAPTVAGPSTSPYAYSSPPSSISQPEQLSLHSTNSEMDDMCYLAQLLFDAPPSDGVYAQFSDFTHQDQPHQDQSWSASTNI